MSLSSLIVQREIATIRQVEEALARQVLYGGDLVTNLLEVAKLDEATLTLLLAESFGLAAATLGPLPNPTERARGLVTDEMASSRAMVPLGIENGALVVAVAEPLPKEVGDELSFALGLKLVQRIAPMVRVREALSRTYGAPLERRLQRLLTRLGAAPAAAEPPPPPPPPKEERASIPPSAKSPFRPSTTPFTASPAPPSTRPRQETQLGLAPPPDIVPQNAPATLVQRSASGQRAPRRRRGPMVAEQAVAELAEASTRDAILDLFFDYSRQYFDYTALFVVQADIAEGREAFGDGASRDKVQGIGVPLDLQSVLAAARDAAAAVRVVPAEDGIDSVLLGDMERTTRGEVLVVPVIVRKRSVALLYGDSGDDGVDPQGVKEVVSFALLVGQAFEKLIVRKKAQAALASGQMPGPASSRPPMPPRAVEQRVPTPPPPPPAPQRAVSEPPDGSAAVDQLLEQTPTPAFAWGGSVAVIDGGTSPPPSPPRATPAHPSDRPPPPNAFVLRRPSGPPIPREDPDEDGAGAASSAPPSETFAVAPHRPPTSRSSAHLVLPSVIVDVNEELGALVDKVIEMGTDEAAETELLRQGQNAMPAIMSRFPGPTVVDRARVEDGSLRAAECGPVLRLIAGQRRAALPFILPIVGDGEPQRRYWATFLITELAYPDVVEPLVPRLFDPDPSVRRVARLAARALGEVAPEALIERLVRYYRDPSLTEERRIEMIETLGELRERLAVPLLIDALEETEEHVAAAARRALMTSTRQDLGRDAKRWQAWWAANGGRHRIEWLIDALMHEVPAVRRAAGDELKAITKEYFGYYDDLPRKEREQAQQRYRDWWRTEGRLRYQRR
ncbi:MAG: HEAT repeat domain-containing protein [Polyangiaceae bacterium]